MFRERVEREFHRGRQRAAPAARSHRIEQPSAMTANPFVILYVEDNDYIRQSFAELLATAERRIVCAADGAGAREAMRDQKVDLLMTDINLPDGSGLDLAREALRQNPGLPVIVCSGHDLTD